MTAMPAVSQSRIRRAVRRSRASVAVLAGGIVLAGSAAGSGLTASAATSPWSVQQVPPADTSTPNAQFHDVSCPTAGACVAVGEYVGTDGIQRTLSERWDGHSWHIVFPANAARAEVSNLQAVSCASARACDAVGGASAPGPNGSIMAESWNGTSWRMVPIQKPGQTFLEAISCATATFCLTVGERTTAAGVAQAVAERWNGQRWLIVTPLRPEAFSQLLGVSCHGPRNCYAVGWTSRSSAAASRPLVEHWNGRRWSIQTISRPASGATLQSVSCPTATSCTAVGQTGTENIRLLVEDLSNGKWTEGLPAIHAGAPGTASFYRVSCSAPRVCTALVRYIDDSEELTWATAARGATGGFNVTVPPGDVSSDNAEGLSCRPVACTIAGGLNTNDGRGDPSGTGTTFAWRGSGGHFTPQVTLNPRGTAGGSLTSVSCVKSGFCAAAASTGQEFVPPGDPSVMVRSTAHGRWTIPANAGSGFLSSISCTSASFCLALGSPSGAERWNGHAWSEVSAPDLLKPGVGGLETISCVKPTFCLAVGSTTQTQAHALAATWNGSSWTTASPAVPAGSSRSVLAGVSCTSVTHCVANGYFLPSPAGSPEALIDSWNGTSWLIASPLHPKVNFPDHMTVSCATASACMASWGGFSQGLTEWWNGSRWADKALAGPSARQNARSILGVSCPSRTSCTAVGSAVFPGPGPGPLVENWNGTRWSVTPSPNPLIGTGSFNAVSCTSATACTAVGSNSRVETVPFAETRG
jgi:hypothetical protein